MTRDRGTMTTIICIVLGMGLGFGVLVLPMYRSARETYGEIADLEYRIENSAAETELLEGLADKLDLTRERISGDFREVPARPDMASLMSALTLPVDGRAVADQTFTAGVPGPIASLKDDSVAALPLKIEMLASFPTCFALVQTVERLPRLVRISSLRMEQSRSHENLLDIEIELQAVFEVPAKAEGNK